MTPRWVFLRGLMRDQRHWGAFPHQFAETLGIEQPLLIDLPGNGLRHLEESPTSVPAMAAWLREELHRLAPPPYRVLAMSLGAMVTVAWAEAHPEDLDAAVLANTSLKPISPFYRRLHPRAWPLLLRMAMGQPTAEAAEQAILALTSRHLEQTQAVVADWVRWRESHPVSRANALRQHAAAARYRAPRRAPAVPWLIANGAGDRLVHPSCSASLAAAWQSPLVVHPTAGHDLPLDDGAWLAEHIRDWLRRTAKSAAATGRSVGR